jgi:hypothetical protein
MLKEVKYKFTEKEEHRECYLITKIQFKKIIKDFNENQFKSNFDEFFYGRDNYYKLFLKKENELLCGSLGYIYQNKIFVDTFFWNQMFNDYNMYMVRAFFEELFKRTSEKNISCAVLPLHKNRKKFKSFKKHNQIFFRSEEEFKTEDQHIKNMYPDHYLLEINYESYFSANEAI